VLVPLVVVPGVVVVPVPGALVAPAGTLLVPPAETLVVPPAGVVFVPPAAGKPPAAPWFVVPELFDVPAFDGPVAEMPLLRLIPGLPTALGLFVVAAPPLTVELPAVLVLFVPPTAPVGAPDLP